MANVPKVDVRRLGPTDLACMDRLLELFAVAFDEPETYRGAVPSPAYQEKLLAKEHFITLVATKGDVIVGGLVAYELEKFEQERSEIYVYDLAVASAHRRSGIATGLIAALKPIAAGRGAHVIYIQADQDNGPAIALYEKLGAREDVHHFDIAVVDPADAP